MFRSNFTKNAVFSGGMGVVPGHVYDVADDMALPDKIIKKGEAHREPLIVGIYSLKSSVRNSKLRFAFRSLRSASISICRTRSRVTPSRAPIS